MLLAEELQEQKDIQQVEHLHYLANLLAFSYHQPNKIPENPMARSHETFEEQVQRELLEQEASLLAFKKHNSKEAREWGV